MRSKVDYNKRAITITFCLFCGAARGKPCVGSSGREVAYTHVERRQAASVLQRQEYAERDARYAKIYVPGYNEAARLILDNALRDAYGEPYKLNGSQKWVAWRHHALGMLQAEISDTLRVHVWHPKLRVFKGGAEDGYRDVHDHRFDLVSYVAHGEIIDQPYSVVNWGEPTDTNMWTINHAKAQKDQPVTGYVYGVRIMVGTPMFFRAGESYAIARRSWHTSIVRKPAITVVHRSNFDDQPAHILSRDTPKSGIVPMDTKLRDEVLREVLEAYCATRATR